jgi:hypothetical protein
VSAEPELPPGAQQCHPADCDPECPGPEDDRHVGQRMADWFLGLPRRVQVGAAIVVIAGVGRLTGVDLPLMHMLGVLPTPVTTPKDRPAETLPEALRAERADQGDLDR